jgi:hypothetical protein
VAILPAATLPLLAGACDETGKDLVTRFRNSADDPEERIEIVARALSLGPEAARALGETIERELRGDLDGYRVRLTRAAASALRGKRASKRELEQLRDTVLALARDPGLTKDRIHAEGDPAVARLRELLLVEPFEVVESSEELAAERRDLLELGSYWEECAGALEEGGQADESGRPLGWPTRDGGFAEILERHERLATALALPIRSSEKKVLLENLRTAREIDPGEALGILDLNALRLLLGLRPLRIDPKLCAAARDHSRDMRTLGFFAHESPVEGKKTPFQRASRFGTSASAENISTGNRSASGTNLGWFHSPGHHRNMLANHSTIGIGRSGTLWTQMFG